MTPIAHQLADDAARCDIAGVPFNPQLPPNFDDTPNEQRPPSHQEWWHRPFLRTEAVDAMDARYARLADNVRTQWVDTDRARWLAAWPSGVRYDVRCLDGGAWDRSTSWGSFATIDEALACVAAGRPWGRAHAN